MSAEHTIPFVDQETQEQGIVIIRTTPSSIGLTVSLRRGGDLEVFLTPEDARLLLDALQVATTDVESLASP